MDELQKKLMNERASAIIDGKPDNLRSDGYTNMLNKYGTSQDNSTAYKYMANGYVSDAELASMYTNGLFSKIIDRPSEEATKHGVNIDYGDSEISAYVNDFLDKLGFEDKFSTAEKWARLFGGSIIVMFLNDGGRLEDPVSLENFKKIEDMVVFEKAVVVPDYNSMQSIIDLSGKYKPLGEPEFFSVSSSFCQFNVHRSRCLVFRNGRLPEFGSSSDYGYWGMPEYVKVKRALRECITAHQDGVKLMERSVQAIYKMKGLAAMLSTDDGEDKVLKRLQVIDMARGILNSIAIDTDGEEYDYKNFSTAGVKEIIDSTCNMLSAVTSIPQSVLFGRSPAGENSTGESDLENYYNMVENIQKQNIKGNLKTLIDFILLMGKNDGHISSIPKYEVKFNPLWSLSELEQANVYKVRADTELVKAQTEQLYLSMQVLDPSEIRKGLKDNEEYGDLIDDAGDLDVSDRDFDIANSTEPTKEIKVKNALTKEVVKNTINKETINQDGGPGSGNFGHGGRKGKRGGSSGGKSLVYNFKKNGRNIIVSSKMRVKDLAGNSYLIKSGSKIKKVVSFAGGNNKPVRVAAFLSKEFGGSPGDWIHVRGEAVAFKNGKSHRVELHWFENNSVGQIKFKVKTVFK